MRPIDPAGFEAKYRDAIDPWNYRASLFERRKRRILLQACGTRTYGRCLELGCSIGETTALLARRCLRVLAVDSSETALREAMRVHGKEPRIAFRQAVLPRAMPPGRFDLIVVSELAYYLTARDLDDLMMRLDLSAAPGCRIVALHHVTAFDDAAQPPARAADRLRRFWAERAASAVRHRTPRYEAVAFDKPRR